MEPQIGGPHAFDSDGVNFCAQLSIGASQLRSYNIVWAAKIMEQASERIQWLEDRLKKKETETLKR